jgi:hypothetical protein
MLASAQPFANQNANRRDYPQSALFFFVGTQECECLFQDIIQKLEVGRAHEVRAPFAPVEAFYLIGEDNAGNEGIVRDIYFPGIAFLLIGDRTNDGQTDRAIILGGGQDKRRPTPGLLVSFLRIEIESNHISTRRDVVSFAHRTSFPTAGPVFTSL